MKHFILWVSVLTLSICNFGHTEELDDRRALETSKIMREITNLKNEIGKIWNKIDELTNGKTPLLQGDPPPDKNGTKSIFDASYKGVLSAVIYYYNEDPRSINKKNEKQKFWAPLMYAASQGRTNVVKYLIPKVEDLDATNTYGDTALLLASFGGHTESMKLLMEKGANINHQNYKKQSALHLAVNANKLESVKLLIQNGINKDLESDFVDDSTPYTYEYLTALELAERKGFTEIKNYLSSH